MDENYAFKLVWLFAYKKPEKAHLFVPFADTVVAFDYVLGQEQQCADTIAAFIEAFRIRHTSLELYCWNGIREHQNMIG